MDCLLLTFILAFLWSLVGFSGNWGHDGVLKQDICQRSILKEKKGGESRIEQKEMLNLNVDSNPLIWESWNKCYFSQDQPQAEMVRLYASLPLVEKHSALWWSSSLPLWPCWSCWQLEAALWPYPQSEMPSPSLKENLGKASLCLVQLPHRKPSLHLPEKSVDQKLNLISLSHKILADFIITCGSSEVIRF
jgi:hypothetical protein